MPGLGGDVPARPGLILQQIAGGDNSPALEKVAIYGAEWARLYDNEKLGFHKIIKNFYYPYRWGSNSM